MNEVTNQSRPPIGAPGIRFGTPAARWVLAATVLGSGIAFLDGTVVNVALPAIGSDLGASLAGLQWIVDAYLVTLCALLLLGGSLGDRLGRRGVFVAGLGLFTTASLGCGLAPSVAWLLTARAVQGVGGALLVPGSLAIISSTFHPDDRAKAIGAWSGLAGAATSLGPFLGGWLIDTVSWRLIFLINMPLAAAAVVIARRHVPETRSITGDARLDVTGAALITIALGAISYAAIEHDGMPSVVLGVVGVIALLGFVLIERTSTHPMLPLSVFASRQFSGANITTLAVYAGLGGTMFLVALRLQVSLRYSALEAGAAFVPFTLLMLVLSPRAGQLSQSIGVRLPMTIGPVVTATGIVLLSAISPGDTFVAAVLPGVVVFALGMALTVAPLTAAVLAGVDGQLTGVASGVNNAAARLAGLLAVAVLPAAAGIGHGSAIAGSLDAGFATALRGAAALTALGSVSAALLVRDTAPVQPVAHPSVVHACHDPGVLAVETPAGATA